MLGIDTNVHDLPIVEVELNTLLPGFSPRLNGEEEANIGSLAGSDAPLPPILVHRPTNRVIDGMHRLLAARLRGQFTLAARYYNGDEADAFVLAVRANLADGLPLTLNDRKAAARRILDSHGHWSDRRIAQATGLSDKTIAAIRAKSNSADCAGGEVRVGRDGRAYRLDPQRRTTVAALLRANPDASLRTVAARAGVSPETVRAVKADIGRSVTRDRDEGAERVATAGPGVPMDVRRCLRVLTEDPALRGTEAGRQVLRVLASLPILEREAGRLLDAVPERDLAHFERVARAHTEAWLRLADRVAAHTNRRAEAAAGHG